jgi:hypothetical protein
MAECHVEGAGPAVEAKPSKQHVIVETEGEAVLRCGPQRRLFDKRTEIDVFYREGEAAPTCAVRVANRMGIFQVDRPLLARCGGGGGFTLDCALGTVESPPGWPERRSTPDVEIFEAGQPQGGEPDVPPPP